MNAQFNMSETQNNELIFEFAVPGYSKEDLDIEIAEHELTVSGKLPKEPEPQTSDQVKQYLVQQLKHGKFSVIGAKLGDFTGLPDTTVRSTLMKLRQR